MARFDGKLRALNVHRFVVVQSNKTVSLNAIQEAFRHAGWPKQKTTASNKTWGILIARRKLHFSFYSIINVGFNAVQIHHIYLCSCSVSWSLQWPFHPSHSSSHRTRTFNVLWCLMCAGVDLRSRFVFNVDHLPCASEQHHQFERITCVRSLVRRCGCPDFFPWISILWCVLSRPYNSKWSGKNWMLFVIGMKNREMIMANKNWTKESNTDEETTITIVLFRSFELRCLAHVFTMLID